jgi:UDP-glucose 4-epimerase
MLAGEPVTIYGDGEQTRDLVYVEDVAAANVLAAERPLPPLTSLDARAYNIGTGVETSVNRLAELIGAAAGRASEILHAPARAGEILRSALDVGKAARELGWRPQVPLPEGLARTVRWIGEG